MSTKCCLKYIWTALIEHMFCRAWIIEIVLTIDQLSSKCGAVPIRYFQRQSITWSVCSHMENTDWRPTFFPHKTRARKVNVIYYSLRYTDKNNRHSTPIWKDIMNSTLRESRDGTPYINRCRKKDFICYALLMQAFVITNKSTVCSTSCLGYR